MAEGSSHGTRVVVVTPVRGRREHLFNQRRFLDAVAPGAPHVIVAVDMPDLPDELAAAGLGGPHVSVVPIGDDPLGMPTARARNVGAQGALEAGADLVVFLDVDCVPLPGFVDALVATQRRLDDAGERAVLNGVVTYLPEDARLDDESPSAATRFIAPHAARPAPADGEVTLDDDHRLLWSLAFALDAEAWRACGGFDERYVGYGGEDTDFGMRAREAGLRMAWVGGAHALHQWHPSANPPRHHVVDIVRNAQIYFDRWGVWPMEGWLQAFADEDLVVWTPTSLTLAG